MRRYGLFIVISLRRLTSGECVTLRCPWGWEPIAQTILEDVCWLLSIQLGTLCSFWHSAHLCMRVPHVLFAPLSIFRGTASCFSCQLLSIIFWEFIRNLGVSVIPPRIPTCDRQSLRWSQWWCVWGFPLFFFSPSLVSPSHPIFLWMLNLREVRCHMVVYVVGN